MVEFFHKSSYWLKVIKTIFAKKLHHRLLIGFLNMPLDNTAKKIRHLKDISVII